MAMSAVSKLRNNLLQHYTTTVSGFIAAHEVIREGKEDVK